MQSRPPDLQRLLDTALDAFGAVSDSAPAQSCLSLARAAAATPAALRSGPGQTLPVCAHLEPALAFAEVATRFRPLLAALRPVVPRLIWRRRATWDAASASANFADGHANAMIVGPGGLEERHDIWLGLSLLAPDVRYPDHDHPPEELYLVVSEGEFCQGSGPWFAPGVDGTFYNPPGIRHAMRSGIRPLLAFWLLWNGRADQPSGT